MIRYIPKKKIAYVYEHWRPDKDVCFWVGKGTGKRSRVFRRNKRYNSIVKHLLKLGLSVEVRIITDYLTEDEAYDLEIERMAFWKNQGVELANQSVGGRGGTSGIKRSLKSRRQQSRTAKGRTLSEQAYEKLLVRVRSLEWKAFNSAVHTGRKRPKITGKRISRGLKRSWADPEVRARREASYNHDPRSEEIRAKLSAAVTPEERARRSRRAKKQWKDPAFAKLISETMARTNARRLHREAGVHG